MAIENHSEVGGIAPAMGNGTGPMASAANATPAAVSAFKKQLQKSLQKTLVKDDTWFLMDARWNKQLSKYLDLSDNTNEDLTEVDPTAHPGRIDNGNLFKDDEPDELREHMMEEMDYVIVPEEAWQILVREFGLTEGQEPIARKVVEHGMFVKHCKVEIYKNDFHLADYAHPTQTKKRKFSKADTIETVIAVMRDLFDIGEDVEVRLWVKHSTNTYDRLSKLESTVQDAGLYTGQLVLIEKQNEDGSWQRASPAKSSVVSNGESNDVEADNDQATSNVATASTSRAKTPVAAVSRRPTTFSSLGGYAGESSSTGGCADKTQQGLCGLSNLGNTCFMNSIVQGLSNTPPIMEYFACDNYIEDINEENPLGMRGEIARSFGEVIKSMWSGKFSYVVPRNFKTAVGRFAPQFSGYQQQDSQELLTFLLDGLHEDLNRVKKKPYIEIKDSGGRPDEEVAAEAWEVYKKRNDSVILDLFHGLLKSTVVCPECPKISVTFDPFCYLSLPLPVRKERQIEVFLVFMDQSRVPTQYKVTCPKSGCMRDLCEALSKLSGVPSHKMVVTDVYNHRFHKIYGPEEGLQQILERDDIFVYEVPTTSRDDPNVVVTPIYLREKKSSMSYSPSNLFGQPLLLGLPRNLDYESLYNHIVSSLSRCITPPSEENQDTWWKASHEMNGEESEKADTKEDISDDLMDDDDEDDEDDENKGPPKMFVMNFVNAYGNAQLEELRNNGEPLKMGKHYLSLDWHPKAKEKFYNEKAAEDVAQDESFRAKPVQRKQIVSLNECLELYTTKEKLGEMNTWRCPDCKKDQQATKKFDLWSLPAVLVISLKRFSFERLFRDKLDTHVDFPIHGLDMAPFIINKSHGTAIYDLIAVSNHYGGMGGGHYTAYAKNKDDGKWYYFDDSNVTPSSESAVVTKAAYVLFYLRRDLSRMSNVCNGNSKPNADASSEEDMDTN